MDIQNILSKKLLPIVIFVLATQTLFSQNIVRYDLYVRDTIVNYSGKEKRAIAVNGQIPMPTLTFTEGDIAEIYVHNELKESTSLHWHGLFLPNKEDGVPNLTQMPIEPGTTHKYSFPIIQSGTHWYHSHSGLQEQIGMYGMFIMNKKQNDKTFRKGIDDLPTVPIILSEWTDLKPENVHRMLHNATDWFAIKKGTTQSYAEAIKQGHFKTKIANEWKRMNAMDDENGNNSSYREYVSPSRAGKDFHSVFDGKHRAKTGMRPFSAGSRVAEHLGGVPNGAHGVGGIAVRAQLLRKFGGQHSAANHDQHVRKLPAQLYDGFPHGGHGGGH